MDVEIARWRLRLAWAIAVGTDFLQMVAFPVVWQGAASPVDDALDFVAGISLILLVGWHWSFVPSFLAELVPGLDLVPTWTAAMYVVSRRQRAAGPKTLEVVRNEPAPEPPPLDRGTS